MPKHSTAFVPRVCKKCGKKFFFRPYPSSVNHGKGKFCSRACRRAPLVDRFFQHVGKKQTSGCILWTGPTNPGGYGQLCQTQGSVIASRFFYELVYGPIPDGLMICHHCDNRRCINPSHLFIGTHAENMADMIAKGRQAKGYRLPQTKLDFQKAEAIRAAVLTGESQKSVGARFGVSQSSVSLIVTERMWKHLAT